MNKTNKRKHFFVFSNSTNVDRYSEVDQWLMKYENDLKTLLQIIKNNGKITIGEESEKADTIETKIIYKTRSDKGKKRKFYKKRKRK